MRINQFKAKKLNPNSAASRRLKASQVIDNKSSSSWDHDRVHSFGSKEDYSVGNLFSRNPFHTDDLGIRKSANEDDISFGNF